MANRITTLFDLDAKGFDTGLKKLRKSVAEADGAINKLKVAGAGLGQILTANLGAAATAAGAAIVAFGVRSVQSFQATALAARDFANATGVAVEDASRLIEVSSDYGIEAGAVQGAIQKMNKAIADGKPVFEDFGVTIARTEDGVVDANATFINAITTIGRIPDATQRAQAAQQAFGKSYGEVSRFMEMSAEELRSALAGVSDQQAITDDESERAERFSLALDGLQDRATGVSNAIGGELVAAMNGLAAAIDKVDEVARSLGAEGGLGDVLRTAYEQSGLARFVDVLVEVGDFLGDNGDEFDNAGAMAEYYRARIRGVSAEQARLGTTAQYSAEQLAKVDKALAESDNEFMSQIERATELRGAYLGAVGAVGELADSASGSTWGLEQQQQLNSATQAVVGYITQLGDVPQAQITEILALLSKGDYDEVARALNALASTRTVSFRPKLIVGGEKDDYAEAAQRGADFVDAFNAGAASRARSSGGGGGGGGASATATPEDIAEQWDVVLKRMFDAGDISLEDYRAYLTARLGAYEKYSDGWQTVTDELDRLAEEEQARLDREAEAEIERQQKLVDAKRAADEAEAERMANMAEVGAISSEDYKAYLRDRLNDFEKYSDDWMAVWRDLQALEEEDQRRKDEAAEDDRRRREEAQRAADEELNRAANRAIVAANIGGATYATINTGADPNAVVDAISRWRRNNGSLPWE